MKYKELFCVCVLGILFQYVFGQIALWWIIHTVTLLWKVLFPFHSRSFENSRRYKHLQYAYVMAALFIPLIPIITLMSKFAVDVNHKAKNGTSSLELFISGGMGYLSLRSPPLLCIGVDRDAMFYSFALPLNLILAVGCTLILIILWSIHKVSLLRMAMNFKKGNSLL